MTREANGKLLVRGIAKMSLAALLALAGFSCALHAQQPPRAELVTGIRHAVSPPMRQIPPQPPQPSQGVIPLRQPRPGRNIVNDPAVQSTTTTATSVNTAAGLNFDGISSDGYIPPDTNLSVGDTQIVQMVNVEYAVYNKATSTMLASGAVHTLFGALGAPCGTSDGGDPVVLYDKAAGRWLISQLEYNRNFRSNYVCLAVSTSSDATGSYNLYEIPFNSDLPDYFKLAVWPDAYYLSANMFHQGSSFIGAKACAFSRSDMLAGNAATAVCFQLPSSVDSLLPSDLDGTTPPSANEPNFFVTFVSNGLNLYRFHADFATPSNSTFTGPIPVGNVAAFTPACGSCIPQPGTSQQLDSLGDRLMFRLAYRNFGDHESLVVNHSVQVSGSSSQTGIRWYEIRDPAGTPSAYQRSTYAPDTSTYRWMGSIAQDNSGDIAVGYSVSNGTNTFPGIRYAGRLVGDPLGTLQGESTVIAGTASQTGSYSYRWGDYSSMSIDPSDDCTFWYTTEYLANGGSFNWNTRIASFKFSACGGTIALPAPSGLTANAGTRQVSLSWSASTGANSYNVKRATTSGGPYTLIINVGTTSYTDTGLADGTTYYYVVTAVDSIGDESGNSNQAAATTTPPAPGGLTATPGDSQVSLSWSTTLGASSYYIYHADPTNTSFLVSVNAPVTSYTVLNLTNGTQYCYTVSAVNLAGESAKSAQACATPQSAPPPTAPNSPTNVQAKVPGKSGKVNLSWTQSTSPNITQNNVYRSTSGGAGYVLLVSLSATTSYSDSTAPKGQSSCYEVTAVNSSGQESAPSTQSNCVTP